MMRDRNERVDLNLADPGASDPGYWDRFHRRVTVTAMAALSARRRQVVPVSFTELVLQWGRAAVPLAAAAAMLAGLTLLDGSDRLQSEPIALEDVLSHGPDGVDLTGLSFQGSQDPTHVAGAEW
jgi:hypothetical protein